jgi:type I restriction enzyme S subunit
MQELVTWRSPDVIVSQSESYPFAGVYSFGRGVFQKETVSGMDFAYDRLTRLRVGEFIYPKLMAWEGALGIVPPECDGCHVSPEFPVFTVDAHKVLPEILDIHFKTPAVWKDLAATSIGTNLRRRRLNPNAFLCYKFPLPPIEVQQHVKAISDRAISKRMLQREAANIEKVLIPSLLDRIFNGRYTSRLSEFRQDTCMIDVED